MAKGEPCRGAVLPRDRSPSVGLGALMLLLAAGTSHCGFMDGGTSLSKSKDDESNLPTVPPPPENGPKLGALANRTPVLEKPGLRSRAIGSLHAGALVARTAEPVRKSTDCPSGFYGIFPRGYVCLDQGATLDLAHPTLVAMAIRPNYDERLPYTYARTRTATPLLERDPASDGLVKEMRKLSAGSGFAVVGSWSAALAGEENQRLGLLPNGRFARAQDLEAAEPSTFSGFELGPEATLPVAFVIKRGVRRYKVARDELLKEEPLEYHTTIPLASRYRTIQGHRCWLSLEPDRWVREQDVTIIHRRTKFPDFARDGQRWIDIGVTLGTLLVYEGQKPLFATLVSTGRDRLGNPELSETAQAVTQLGTFEVTGKSATLLDTPPERFGERYPLFDIPWAIELSSGQFVHGAYWHDRFGIEHGSGDVMLSPADARRVWHWVTPELPKSWHSVTTAGEKTIVHVHK